MHHSLDQPAEARLVTKGSQLVLRPSEIGEALVREIPCRSYVDDECSGWKTPSVDGVSLLFGELNTELIALCGVWSIFWKVKSRLNFFQWCLVFFLWS